MPQLFRHSRDPKHFELLRVLDEFARAHSLSIDNDATHHKLIAQLSDSLQDHRTNPIRLYGFRTEAMFAHVAAALGHCEIIVEEDAGIHYDSDPNSASPDFRILTLDREQFFVEVKNVHQNKPFTAFKLTAAYLRRLHAYTAKFGLALKIATYWSKWNIWTLVDSTKLLRNGDDHYLNLGEAFARSEMATLGDCMVGTVPPLSLRLYADPAKPREIDESGQARFTIERVALMSGSTELHTEADKKIAWFLFLYGKWTDFRQPVSATHNKVDFMELSANPEEYDSDNGWAIAGALSSMVSNQYIQQTSVDGVVKRLSPLAQPDTLGVIIPQNFHGDDLRLWRFSLQPSFDGLATEKEPK